MQNDAEVLALATPVEHPVAATLRHLAGLDGWLAASLHRPADAVTVERLTVEAVHDLTARLAPGAGAPTTAPLSPRSCSMTSPGASPVGRLRPPRAPAFLDGHERLVRWKSWLEQENA